MKKLLRVVLLASALAAGSRCALAELIPPSPAVGVAQDKPAGSDQAFDATKFRVSFWLSCNLGGLKDGKPFALRLPITDGGADAGQVQMRVGPAKPEWAQVEGTWQLEFQISGKKGQERITCSIEDWKPGQWRHVAMAYESGVKSKQSGGRPMMGVFVDGEPVAMSLRAPRLTGWGKGATVETDGPACAVTGLRIDNSADAFTSRSLRWEGFLPGEGAIGVQPEWPVYVFFSQPMDRERSGISLIDMTTQQIVPAAGQWIGDGSVYKLAPDKPLPLGRRFTIRLPSGDQALRSIDGVAFDASTLSEQSFPTRQAGQPPQVTEILFRNDNLHTSLEGTHRMLQAGIDLVEINPVKLQDAWVSNHGNSRNAEKLPTNLRAGEGGDQAALDKITTPLEQTTYATVAAIDFVDTKDGKVDSIGRLEDQIRLVSNWDKLIEIQGLSEVSKDEYRAIYEKGGLNWDRVLAFHGPAACCYEKPTAKWVHPAAYPRAKNFLVGRATYLPGNLEETDPLFPNGITPAFVAKAKADGKMLWMYAFSNRNESTLLMAARLGIDVYVPDNDMAFLGNTKNREWLYQFNAYERAAAPKLVALTCGDQPLEGQKVATTPELKLAFSLPMEARSLNYDTVRLTPASGDRAAMTIRPDAERKVFTLKPMQPLQAGQTYTLTIDTTDSPKSVAGQALATPVRVKFMTAPK